MGPIRTLQQTSSDTRQFADFAEHVQCGLGVGVDEGVAADAAVAP